MASIQKIAITDARLMQDEPAYAVQKGALSISVAPFQAIAASAGQMTFQVLVPSLNVFVDRKIVLSTPLSFNASLFWGGPRTSGGRYLFSCTNSAALAIGATSLTTSAAYTLGVANVSANDVTTFVDAYKMGQPCLLLGSIFAPNTIITNCTGSNATLTISFQPGLPAAIAATATNFNILRPDRFDVPDPAASTSSVGYTQGTDYGQSLPSSGIGPAVSGYATAVSSKDLAYTQFPIQSCIVNMTATLNDCTTTTNGDTLREQLLLTSSQATLKQRTTPTNCDTFAWGRDDVQNNSGNFSSYAVTNQYGDVANGAWPTAWSSDTKCSTQLAAAAASVYGGGVSTLNVWPLIPVTSNVYSFYPQTAIAGDARLGGIGWYVAAASTQVTLPTGFSGNNAVFVPFVNYQPVWTTNFPGGDLYGAKVADASYTSAGFAPAFSVSGNVLSLNVAVPPMCMVGARLYDAVVGSYSVTAAATATPTATSGILGIIYALASGTPGQPGSTYSIQWAALTTGTPTLVAAQTGGSVQTGIFGLQGGCPIGMPLPVYGTLSCAEPLVISPLIWADAAEFQSVGLYGMTNMQFVLNFATLGTARAVINSSVPLSGTAVSASTTYGGKPFASQPYWVDDLTLNNPNVGNIVRSSNVRSVLSDLTYAVTGGSTGPWGAGPTSILGTASAQPTLYATFLTPGVDVKLPDVSTVPYLEMPRYFQSMSGAMVQGDNKFVSQTISLTSIPDMIMVYVKPSTRGPSQMDQWMPINNVAVTFDNFSNLCSNFQQVHLYECAVAAGLDMDWHQWRGFTQAAQPSAILGSASGVGYTTAPYAYTQQSPFTQLSGGPIILRMGQDISLQPGLAPGCLGNYSLQVTVTVDNRRGFYNYAQNPVLTIIAINSGFFESMRGQSAIRKTILQMADVAAATTESGMSKSHLHRLVGTGFGLPKSFSNMVQKGLGAAKAAKDINDRYHITDLARTYGGSTGAALANAADMGLSAGASAHDSLYGQGHPKRHRSSGIMM